MKYIHNPVTNTLDKTEDIGNDEKLFENLPILNQGINAPKKPLEITTSLNLPKTSNVKKKISTAKPIKEKNTWYFDKPEGINHLTKTLHDTTDIAPGEAKLLNKEMKLGVLKSEIDGLKPFDNFDKTTYPSDPETRRRLKNISSIEKDLGYVAKPTKTVAQINREEFLKKKKDREFKIHMEKEYGKKAINQRNLKAQYQNKKAGKDRYDGFASHDLIIAEVMKDEAKEKLKKFKPVNLDMGSIESGIREIEETRKILADMKKNSNEARDTYLRKLNEPDPTEDQGIGSILPKRRY